MLIEIGTIIKKYQNQNCINSSESNRLLKAKEVIELYPILTSYGLNDAVKRGLIPVIKRGKLNFYDSKDIEKYINELKNNNSSEIKNITPKSNNTRTKFV
ncbi:MAG: hypothetical protein IJO33_00190 [Bacilli bacterium]|nr:hypothetical protein [Bacilli bacterium]